MMPPHALSSFNRRYTLGIYGYVYVYSVASRRSFEMVKIINDKLINDIGHDHFPRVHPRPSPPTPHPRTARAHLNVCAHVSLYPTTHTSCRCILSSLFGPSLHSCRIRPNRIAVSRNDSNRIAPHRQDRQRQIESRIESGKLHRSSSGTKRTLAMSGVCQPSKGGVPYCGAVPCFLWPHIVCAGNKWDALGSYRDALGSMGGWVH